MKEYTNSWIESSAVLSNEWFFNITFFPRLSDWKFQCKHLEQEQTHKWGIIWTNIIVREMQDSRISTPDKIRTRIELIDNLNNIIEIINFSPVMEPWTSPWIAKRHPHAKPFQSLWLGPTALCLLRQIMFTKIIACLDLSFGQWYVFEIISKPGLFTENDDCLTDW